MILSLFWPTSASAFASGFIGSTWGGSANVARSNRRTQLGSIGKANQKESVKR